MEAVITVMNFNISAQNIKQEKKCSEAIYYLNFMKFLLQFDHVHQELFTPFET